MSVGTAQGLITRCPGCSTAFRASAEQLAARSGQVRCGRCSRVFDALANRIDSLNPESRDDGTSPVAGESASPQDVVIEPTSENGEPAFADLDQSGSAWPTDIPGPSAADHLDDAQHPERDRESAGAVDEYAFTLASTPNDVTAEEQPDAGAALREEFDEESVGGSGDVRLDTPAVPSPFDRPASAEPAVDEMPPRDPSDSVPRAPPLDLEFGRPKSGPARIPLWLSLPTAFLLITLLAGQIAYQFRGDMVLLFPVTRVPAEQLCAQIGCTLPSPQRAELMSIEASDLHADSTNPAVMVLSATVRNRAPFPQAQPALELTLTDAQDQALARRVIGAGDYSIPGVQNNVFPASSELPVKIYFESSSVKATGYRLYLFYP